MSRHVEVPEPIQEQLRLGLVRMEDFRPAVARAELHEIAQPPGCYRTRIELAVPRPLDPEVAELRQLEVFLRPLDEGFEVFSVRGLNLEGLGDTR